MNGLSHTNHTDKERLAGRWIQIMRTFKKVGLYLISSCVFIRPSLRDWMSEGGISTIRSSLRDLFNSVQELAKGHGIFDLCQEVELNVDIEYRKNGQKRSFLIQKNLNPLRNS